MSQHHNNPKVAILTPVYNGADFLRDALDCVQAQTYSNIVHFVLDNASTDETPDIIREYHGRRVPIASIRNESLLPLCANWNRCVSLGAPGSDYFRILCADDTMPVDAIETMVALGEGAPNVAVVCGQQETENGVADFGWDSSRQVFDGREAVREFLMGHAWFAAPHLMYRTVLAAKRHPFFEHSIMAFDTEAAFRLLAGGGDLGVIHSPMGFTRFHESSITNTQLKPMHRDFYDWYVILNHYGSRVLTPAELDSRFLAFRRHYFGRLLVWRFKHRNRSAFDWHIGALRALGGEPALTDFLDSLSHFGLRKLGLRERWNSWPEG